MTITAPSPLRPLVYGPYGQVPFGARYSTQQVQLERDGVEVHTYESVGDTLSLARVKSVLATPGARSTASGGKYGVSYHAFPKFPEGPAGEYEEVLDERHAPNAGGTVLNRRLLHFCLWGRAWQSREEWLDAKSFPQLQALAHYIADKSRIHHFPIEHLACDVWYERNARQRAANVLKAISPGKVGVIGHRDATACLVWGGNHGDPGGYFPWDVVEDLTLGYLIGDDMAQLVAIEGEIAAFAVSGGIARWIPSYPTLLQWQVDKTLATGWPQVWPVERLQSYLLAGVAPGEERPDISKITAANFAGRIPVA